jgi:uncharacterized membrane protein YjjP (DUF1212 family)
MAGGYFDLPLSSNPNHTRSHSQPGPVATEETNGPSLSSHTSPLPTPNENPGSDRGSAPGGAQSKPRNAGILKGANRVKFTVNEPELQDEQRRSRPTSDEGVLLPQKPAPTVRIPYAADKLGRTSVLPPPLTDDGSNASSDVTGSTLQSRANSPGPRDDENHNEINDEKGRAIHSAQERAQRLASLLSRSSTPKSPRPSPRSSLPSSIASTPTESALFDDGDEIPLITLPEKQFHDSTDEDEEGQLERHERQRRSTHTSEAHLLVRQMTRREFNPLSSIRAPSPGLRSGQVTPIEERDPDAYVAPPTHYRGGILSTLLKLYEHQPGQTGLGGGHHFRNGSLGSLGDSSYRGRSLSRDSGINKPPKLRKWYDKSPELSTTSLVSSSAKNSFSSASGQRPILKRSRSSGGLSGAAKRLMRPHLEDEIRITVHIAEILSRQRYLMRLCRALMKYGAPTHRLEEYMRMTARVLEIDGQFLYIPGCMIISFDDSSTHTTEVKLVKSSQGVDLGRLANVHQIYKEVVHDVVGVEEAIQRLDEVMKKKPKFNNWVSILMHGFASATVGPFAFGARPIDLPIAFVLGCLVGMLQLVLSPRSYLYSNVFEITAAVLTSFLARAFGSIRYQGEYLFCFSALAQSSIALILPGYIVLCGSLELQSRSIVAGSVRMVYAIIYSLFLGFGITIGTAVYGLIDGGASSAYTCPKSPITNEYLQRFPFVVLFTFCLTTINQAKWRQVPVMLVISLCGYLTNYFSLKRFGSNTQMANALGAFVIGVMGNLYSRLRHGLAAAAILPAIFVQVPSGLAASGSLVSGLTSAEQITGNQSFYNVINNGTQGFYDAQNASSRLYGGMVFDIGYGMVQVAIGITVGLFLAALVVYPLGKKRSGLFSF